MNEDNTISSIQQITGFTDSELKIVLKYFESKYLKKKTCINPN